MKKNANIRQGKKAYCAFIFMKGGFALAELYMSEHNEELLGRLIKDGILQSFNLTWLSGQTARGGIPIICSDGTIDARTFLRRAVPETNVVQVFGGPVIFSPSYRDYDEEGANFLLKNIRKGQRLNLLKQNKLVFTTLMLSLARPALAGSRFAQQ